ISVHPEVVGDDDAEIISELRKLIGALEYSVVSTTHTFEWTAGATLILPMAGWAEEAGTYTNYAGRVQLTNRAVMPPDAAQPLHVFMAEMLELSGVQVPHDPSAIFEWIGREVPLYSGIDYDSIGLLGMTAVQTPQEVLR